MAGLRPSSLNASGLIVVGRGSTHTSRSRFPERAVAVCRAHGKRPLADLAALFIAAVDFHQY